MSDRHPVVAPVGEEQLGLRHRIWFAAEDQGWDPESLGSFFDVGGWQARCERLIADGVPMPEAVACARAERATWGVPPLRFTPHEDRP